MLEAAFSEVPAVVYRHDDVDRCGWNFRVHEAPQSGVDYPNTARTASTTS